MRRRCSSLIQQAVQLGNTQDENGNYIFSGTACDTKPFLATTTNGKITAVTCALVGGTELAQSEIAPNTKVSAQVLARGAEGLFTNTTTGADLFNHMLALQSDLESGNTSAISSTDAPALQTDEDNIVDQISANAVTQSALSAASSLATAQSTNLTTQISGDTSADMATTLTELSQTQTAYEAALEERNEGDGHFIAEFPGLNALRSMPGSKNDPHETDGEKQGLWIQKH